MKKYVPQNRRVIRSVQPILPDTETIYRPAQDHFDVVKSGIVDGVSSTTGIFDESFGDVPEIFRQDVDKLELADALLRAGASTKQVEKVASDGVEI